MISRGRGKKARGNRVSNFRASFLYSEECSADRCWVIMYMSLNCTLKKVNMVNLVLCVLSQLKKTVRCHV